jgi:hypothetical protein
MVKKKQQKVSGCEGKYYFETDRFNWTAILLYPVALIVGLGSVALATLAVLIPFINIVMMERLVKAVFNDFSEKENEQSKIIIKQKVQIKKEGDD